MTLRNGMNLQKLRADVATADHMFPVDLDEMKALFEVVDALMEFYENEDPEGVRGEVARLYNKTGLVLLKHGLIEPGE